MLFREALEALLEQPVAGWLFAGNGGRGSIDEETVKVAAGELARVEFLSSN